MTKIKSALKCFIKSFLWLIPLLILLDLGTKLACYYANVNITVIPNFFYLRLERNTGAAWSLFEDYPAILAILSIVCTIAISFYLVKKYQKLPFWTRISLMLIIAGAAGNMIDRTLQLVPGTIYYQKGVIDFLAFRLFNSYDFPVFNVADMCLVIGVFILIIVLFVEEMGMKDDKKQSE